jgi:Flp pilus assembly pilin Flp
MMIKILSAIVERADEERGAVAGEYAVLLTLIAVALITVIGLFTGAIIRAFDAAIAVLPAA